MNPWFFQVNLADQLTVKTVVKVCGDPAVFPVQPAFPGLPVLPVWTVTASRHSASCPWWRRRFLQRTPAWRAPVRCEGLKTERLEEKPGAEDLSIWVFCHLVCMFLFFVLKLSDLENVILFSWRHLCGYKVTRRWTLNSTPHLLKLLCRKSFTLPQFCHLCTVRPEKFKTLRTCTDLPATFLTKQQRRESEKVSLYVYVNVSIRKIILLDDVHLVCEYLCRSSPLCSPLLLSL